MKQKKQWFAYLPLDRKGVEAYLNDQAEKGWALAAEQDGMTFRVPFQETNRTDLRYHVTCDAYQGEKLAEIVAEKQVQGWRPVATINHFDIYESMPCQESQTLAQGRSKRLYFYAFRSWLILLLLATALIAIAWVNQIALPFQSIWYLSNLGVFLRCTFPVFAVGSIYYLLWLGCKCFSREDRTPKRSGMLLRSGLQVAAGVWLLLALVALLLDLVTNLLAFCALLLFLVAGMVYGYVRLHWGKTETFYSAISLILAVVLGTALLLSATNPSDSRAEVGNCAWRNSVSDVVHAEDLDLHPNNLQAASYEQTGSLLVTRTDYWESWEDLSLSSTVYNCKGGVFQSIVVNQILAEADWTQTESKDGQAWRRQVGETYYVLLVQEDRVVTLSCDQPLKVK